MKPDLPAVRIGFAGRRIAEDKLDEAHELLRFLESPGAGSCTLSGAWKSWLARTGAGRHAETLETCKHLLAEVPALGQTLRFRYLVAASEKALGRDESILPGPRVSVRVPSKVRWAAVAAAGLVLAAAGLLVANEFLPSPSDRLRRPRRQSSRAALDRRPAARARRPAGEVSTGRGPAPREGLRTGQRGVRHRSGNRLLHAVDEQSGVGHQRRRRGRAGGQNHALRGQPASLRRASSRWAGGCSTFPT